jgi:hypothetical protein
MTPRRGQGRSDPLAALGLPPDATAQQIRQARNRLAKRQHPDVGGSQEAMQRINDAATAALAAVEQAATRSPAAGPAPGRPAPPPRSAGGRIGRDHPSFTIEALPVEAYEALLIVASVLGQVGDDDPPYRLEVVLEEPIGTWCRLELVPDGGGSTVSLTVATPGRDVSVDDVRDLFITELNQLDWHDDGPRRRPL